MRRFITQRHSVSCRPVSTNTGLFGGFGMEKEGAELGSRGRPRDRLVGSLASIAPSWRLPQETLTPHLGGASLGY